MNTRINNVRITQGEFEFNSEMVYKYPILERLLNTWLTWSVNIPMVDEINKENGVLHLSTNENYDSVKGIGLYNVSDDLERRVFKEN